MAATHLPIIHLCPCPVAMEEDISTCLFTFNVNVVILRRGSLTWGGHLGYGLSVAACKMIHVTAAFILKRQTRKQQRRHAPGDQLTEMLTKQVERR